MMRRVLIHVVAGLIAVPFALCWNWGLDRALDAWVWPFAGVVSLLIRWGGSILGLPFLVLWISGPAFLRILRFPAVPRLVPFDPRSHSLPNEGLRSFDDAIAVLRAEDFEPIAAYIQEHDDKRVHWRLLEHRAKRTVAQLYWCKQFSGLAFRTATMHGQRMTLTSRGVSAEPPPPPWQLREHFPGLDARSLWAVHCALVERDGGAVDGRYRDEMGDVRADPLAWVSALEKPIYEWRCDNGIMSRAGDAAYRLRWRWAALLAWRQLFPWRALYLRARSRRAKTLLHDLGFGFAVGEAPHGASGAFGRAVTGPLGAAAAATMIAFTGLALIAPFGTHESTPSMGNWHPATAEHECPCGVAAAPEEARETIAMFENRGAAVEAAAELRAGGASLVELPDALFVADAMSHQVSMLRAKGARIFSESDQSLQAAMTCTAASPEDARAVAGPLNDYFETALFGAIPPWVTEPTSEQARARHTLRFAMSGLEREGQEEDIDRRVAEAFAARPHGEGESREAYEAWERRIGELIGAYPPNPMRRASHGSLSVRGSLLSIEPLGRLPVGHDVLALARYLCAKGCRDVRYGFSSFH